MSKHKILRKDKTIGVKVKCHSTNQTSLNALFTRTKPKIRFVVREFSLKRFSIILPKQRRKKRIEIIVVAVITDDAPSLQSWKKNIDLGGQFFKLPCAIMQRRNSSKPPFHCFLTARNRREVPM